MDFMRLNNTTWIPNQLIEGYSSLIWTERFSGAGDFEMHTPLIDATRALLKEGDFVTHLETKEVMIVETALITKNDEGVAELVYTGRTVETFLENRESRREDSAGLSNWLLPQRYTPGSALGFLIYAGNIGNIYSSPSSDILPNLALTLTNNTGTSQYWTYQNSSTYANLVNFMMNSGNGIRNKRPSGIREVEWSYQADGLQNLLAVDPEPKLVMDIYKGFDRTLGQTNYTPVIFQYEDGHLKEASYLFTLKDFKNAVTVHHDLADNEVTLPGVFPSGWNKRGMAIDAGDTSGIPGGQQFLDYIQQIGTAALMEHNKRVVIDSELSIAAPYKYKTHFDLGDKVTCLGSYGIVSSAIVTEYIRTEDFEGDRGFPTLVQAG